VTARYRVRVLPDLFLTLEAQLPQERDDTGRPTVAEFEASDLLDIVTAFESLWDELPESIAGRSDYRKLILTTRLAPFVVVRGQLSRRDGVIELYNIQLDFAGLVDPDDDEHDQDTDEE
jgi:hypothetical protein